MQLILGHRINQGADQHALYADDAAQLSVEKHETYDFFESPTAWCLVLGAPILSGLTTKTIEGPIARRCLEIVGENGEVAYLAKTEGHFMVVVYDKTTHSLKAFNDPLGLYHAFYAETEKSFCLSSSMVGVLRNTDDQRASKRSLDFYLTFTYIPNPYTIFENVFQLPVRGVLNYALGSLGIKRYELTSAPGSPKFDTSVPIPGQLKKILINSLSKQLPKSSARGVGAFLSGGMDTSTNVVLASELGIKPEVFTASFKEKTYDETPYARVMAKEYGLKHHVITIDETTLEYLDAITRLYDNPIADRAILPEYVICKQAKDMGITQMISGEGGDEVMGYPRNMAEDITANIGAGFTSKQLAEYYYGLTTLAKQPLRKELLPDFNNDIDYLERLYNSTDDSLSPFEKIYYGQWQTWLIDGVLMKDMQVITGNDLAFASPFINNTAMQYMRSLQLEQKIHGLRNKAFVKQALGSALPDKIVNKVKHKFYVPIGEWFMGDSYEMLHETVMASGGFCDQNLNMKFIAKMLEEHRTGAEDYNRPLWALLFLNLWYKNKLAQLSD